MGRQIKIFDHVRSEPRGDSTLKFAATLTYRNPHSTGFSNLSTHSEDPITAPSTHHLDD